MLRLALFLSQSSGLRRCAYLSTLLLCACKLLALDPAAALADYIRTDFTVENGLPSNVVNAVLQTRNGFLWIGTDAGLARFNGKQFTQISLRAPQSAPQGIVNALVEAPNGDLWVGTDAGIARIERAALNFFNRSLVTYYNLGEQSSDDIRCLRFDRHGALWAGTSGGLFRLVAGKFTSVLRNTAVFHIDETAEGHLLVATVQGFREWNGTRMIDHPEAAAELKVKGHEIFQVFEDQDRTLWYCSMHGLSHKTGKGLKHLSWKNYSTEIFQDAQGTIWTYLATGVYRVTHDRLERLANTSSRVMAADAEGDLWVGTNGDGLLRFKDRAVRMYSQADGLPSAVAMTVLRRSNGSLWVGNNCGGLSRFDGTHFSTFNEKDGLKNSCIWSLAEDQAQNLWVGTWGGGLFRLTGARFTQYTPDEGLPSYVVRALQAANDGSLWIATDAGVSHMVKGSFRNYTVADGLSSNHVLAIYQDRHGRIWAGTSHGIDRFSADRFEAIRAEGEMIDSRYISFGEDQSGNLFALGSPKGVELIRDSRLATLVPDLDLFSMIFLKNWIWFSGGNGLVSLDAAGFPTLNHQNDLPFNFQHFGLDDGMNSQQCSVGSPNMAQTPDGSLWVATVKGLARLRPAALCPSSAKPNTFISEVTIGRARRPAGPEAILPPGSNHLELHFAAVSLKSPEKIRFQYRLEDVDSGWLDSGETPMAVYTNISAGSHIFHVRACNADGVWDSTGIRYVIVQQPYLYQTLWFRLAAAAALSLLLAITYLRHVRQVAQRYNLLLEERLTERNRIARELHDTLLQSFQGLMFRFQAVSNMLPGNSERAKNALDVAIDRAAQAITEGREAVEELRNQRIGDDLALSITQLGRELRDDRFDNEDDASGFYVVVEGTTRPLKPLLWEDIFRITSEALRNAFRHSQANRIEVEIRYGARTLRIRVRDDGVGIDPAVLQAGRRPGHWGLPGMRERAKIIGIRVDLWSQVKIGTEVEITAPARLAYLPVKKMKRKEI